MGSEPPAEPALAPTAADNQTTTIRVSRGLASWLQCHRVSLALTTYQTGQLFLVGARPDGEVSLNQQNYVRAMGLCHQPGRLYLGAQFQIWRLENMLRPGEIANGVFDSVFVPRNAQTIADVDVHEIGVTGNGAVIFVNTRYSCLATLDLTYSFRPVWKPAFISRLAPEDRCHLNGLAMADGAARYVTAVSRSDVLNGWRERRGDGGVLIDVARNEIVADGLSMPHSPRVANGALWLLESGRGRIARVDAESGRIEDVAFCPGFLRGLAMHDGHAIVTLSKPRDGSFAGLALEQEMAQRDATPWCGVQIIDLATGDIVEWLRFDGIITELFDIVAMPDVACPMSLGIDTQEIRDVVTFVPLG